MKYTYLNLIALYAIICTLFSCSKGFEDTGIDFVATRNSVLLEILDDNPGNTLSWDRNLNNVTTWEGVTIEGDKLVALEIDGKNITNITENIKLLEDLTILRLRDSELVDIPNELFELKNLEILSLFADKTNFNIDREGFLEGLYGLTNLRELTLDSFFIQEIDGISSLSRLEKLTLIDVSLTNIPEEIEELSSLTVLDLANNSIQLIPPELVTLTALEELNLGGNRSLESLPEDIDTLRNLKKLVLAGNSNLKSFNMSIFSMTSLTSLDLSDNGLGDAINDFPVPDAIGNLTELTELSVSNNFITAISPEIGNLNKLETLDVSRNLLNNLPEGIGNLTNLDTLNLLDNREGFTLAIDPAPEACQLVVQGTTILIEESKRCL